MTNDTYPISADDISVKDIYGIYQNRCKAFWECKIANIKLEQSTTNHYILKEVNLDTSEILTTYSMFDKNTIIDLDNNKFTIPVFYNEIDNLSPKIDTI